MIKSVCILNFTRMGDLIQSGPLLQEYRRRYPEATVVLIVLEAFRSTAERLPMVDKVIGFDVDHFAPLVGQSGKDLSAAYLRLSDFVKQDELKHVDMLINLSHTPLSATIATLLNARQVIGMYRRPDGHMSVMSDWINYLLSLMQDRSLNPFNLVEIYLRLAGYLQSTPELSFRVTETDKSDAISLLERNGIRANQPMIVLQAGASSNNRRWPQARFAALAHTLHSKGYQPVLVGSRDEQDLTTEIVRRSANKAVSLAGQTSIGSLGAILEMAEKLVSNDTGTIHLAAAVNTPTVGIYLGPAAAKDTAPFGNGHLIVEADLECAPCGYAVNCDNHRCRDQVSVEVVEALCLLHPNQLQSAIRHMQGIRVFETKVDVQGRFRLLNLNNAELARETVVLDFYRTFWNQLAGWKEETDSETVSSSHAMQRAHSGGWLELQRIHYNAVVAFHELVEHVGVASPEKQSLTRLFDEQTVWQNELRSFMKRFPVLAALPRFLLVRLTTVRTARIDDYLYDMDDILTTFGRGMSILSGHESMNLTKTISNVRYQESTCS